jgi:hypothetical protein
MYHNKSKNEIKKYTKIDKIFFDRKAKIPSKNQLKSTMVSKMMENQFKFGIKSYKLETIKPKVMRGVAEPLIISSGVPVYCPESQS